MPLYEYEEVTTGRRVELCRSVAERDRVPANLRRVTVPRRLAVQTGILAESDVDRAVPAGFRALEQTVPADEIARQSGFSVEHIKRVWAMCVAFGLVCLGSAAADLSAGYTFVDNEKNITAAKLNAVVGGAVVNPAFLTLKTPASSFAAGDLLLVYSQSAGDLRRGSLADVLYNNTALITAVTEYYVPWTNDYLLLYTATNNAYRKIEVANLFTNWPSLAGPLSALPALSSPSNNPLFLVWDGGTNLAYNTVSLTNLPSLLTPTNLTPATVLTNNELLTLWDPTNQAARSVTLPLLGNALAKTVGTNFYGYLTNGASGAGVLITNAHGITTVTNARAGAVPGSLRAVMVCLTNNNSFVAGQEVEALCFNNGTSPPFTWGADTTNVWLAAGALTPQLNVFKADGSAVNVSASRTNWAVRLYVRP